MSAPRTLAVAVLASTLGCGACRKPQPLVEVSVLTRLPGADPASVEREVTLPLERALAGLPALRRVSSRSREGQSELIAAFEPTVQLPAARQEVLARLSPALATLPAGVTPELGAPGTGVVLRYLVSSPALSAVELRTLQDWKVRTALMQVPGVADVTTCGGREARVEVRVDPARLAALRLSLADVVHATADSGEPGAGAPAGGGLVLRHAGATRLDELGPRRVAMRDDTPILLRDVATISSGGAPPTCLAANDGSGAVVGEVWLAAGADATAVTKAVAERLRREAAALPPGVTLPVFDEATAGSPEHVSFALHLALPPGVTWPEAERAASRVSQALAAPEVKAVLTMVPLRAELVAVVALQPKSAWPAERVSLDAVLTGLLARVAQVPGLGQPRITAALASRPRALEPWRPVGVRLRGSDLDALAALARKASDSLRGVEGVSSVSVEGVGRTHEVTVQPDREALARYGLQTAAVTTAMQAATGGLPAADLFEGDRRVEVMVTLPMPSDDPSALAQLSLTAPDGSRLPLSQVARLVADDAPAEILRDQGQRCVLLRVTAPTLAPRALEERANAALRELQLPPGVTLDWDLELRDP